MSNHMTAGEMQLIDIQKRFIAEQRQCLMSKREQLVTAAMQGILASGVTDVGEIVDKAYAVADAVIEHDTKPKAVEA